MLHLLDLFFNLIYFFALVHFLLDPPTARTVVGWRERWLLFYATTQLVGTWSMYLIPYLILILSFLPVLPFAPEPGHSTFSVLHVAFALHLLCIHLPNPPSPVFLSQSRMLPLSTLLFRAATRVYLPLLFFFLPALVVTTVILSLSLVDPFFPPQLLRVTSPMETRTVLLAVLIGEVVLLYHSFIIMSITFGHPISPGDVHSPSKFPDAIRFQAQKALNLAVVRYANPAFPPPFNIIKWFCIQLPGFVFRDRKSQEFLRVLEKILWRVVVGPFGLIGAVTVGLALQA